MEPTSPPSKSSEQESVSSLLSGLIGDLQNLIRGEVALAKTEVREEAQTAARGAALLGVAAVVALVGLIIFMVGVAVFLFRWLDDWKAFGLVGLVLLVLSGITGIIGKRRLSAAEMKPQRTIDSLKEDKEWASHQAKSLKN